jgi:Flp pilus assembly protein TadD
VVVNNLAYVYLMLGNAKAARPILESLKPKGNAGKELSNVSLTVTSGLLHIVEGDLELGQQ